MCRRWFEVEMTWYYGLVSNVRRFEKDGQLCEELFVQQIYVH